ncbi:hypothetical protein A2U01_0084457, partial [Trifolium medium]|nr:hypothetical protein [Trifolium medium]
SVKEKGKVGEVVVTQPVRSMAHPAGRVVCGSGKGVSSIPLDNRDSLSICSSADGRSHPVSVGGHEGSPPRSSRMNRTKSCPPGANR